MKHIIILMFSCVCSLVLHAQETYIWQGFQKNAVGIQGPTYYEMYQLDIQTGDRSLLFTIDSIKFTHSNMTGFSHVIRSFCFNKDHTEIYFLEEEGDLFRYNIASNTMIYLMDLTPRPSGTSILWHAYTHVRQIDLIDETSLYITGQTFGWYDILTNTFSIIRQIADHPTQFTDFEKSISKVKHFKHKDKWFGKNIFQELTITTFDNPGVILERYIFDNSSSFFNYDFISYQYDCDSTLLYSMEYNIPQDSLVFNKFNLKDTTVSFFKSIVGLNTTNLLNYIILDVQHVNETNWEDCQRRIDLDVDDSTVGGVDFLMDSLCSFDNSPLSDLDLKISNEYPIDSIKISIIDPLFTQYLHFPTGNYTLRQGDNFWQVIVNNGSTSIADYEDAIRNAYFYTGIVSSEVQIEFTIWYDGVPGNAAIATLRLASDLPMSGDDVEQEWCIGDIGLTLEYILATNADIGGDFYDKNYNIITSMPEYIAAGTDTIYYITNNNICYDTALIVNIINPVPIVEPLPDVTLCDNESTEIDLSKYLEDVEWNNGSINKIRILNQAGIYSYELQNIQGCSAVDTFEVTKLPPPVTKPIEAKVCIGEQFNFMNKAYTEAGVYRDTLPGVHGCDSIIYNIDFDYYKRLNIELVGDLEFCEGESITLEVISQHNDLMINDEATGPFLMIDQAGSYIISGYDQNGCFQSEEIEIFTNPNPVVTTQDLIDTVFTSNLELPVQYQGTIITYDWSPISSLSCEDCSYPTIIAPESGTYFVEVTDENGCNANGQVVVKFKESNIFLPTIISKNPIFEENGILNLKGSIASKYSLQVYDRWGNLQYNQSNLTINDSSQGWRPSRDIVQGVYVYMITYSDGQEIKKIAGDITIIE